MFVLHLAGRVFFKRQLIVSACKGRIVSMISSHVDFVEMQEANNEGTRLIQSNNITWGSGPLLCMACMSPISLIGSYVK